MTKIFILTISVWLSFVLTGCGFMGNNSAINETSSAEILAAPVNYNGRMINAKGLLILTSGGTFLFESCEARSKFDLYRAFQIIGLHSEDMIHSHGEWVSIDAEFVAGVPNRINSFHRLINIKRISVEAGPCRDN